MSHLSQNDREHIQKELKKQRAGALKRVDELKAQDPFADPDRLNDNAASDVEASEESNHERVAALIEELNKQVSAIDEALGRIDKGTYGVCLNCGISIEPARLTVMPTATLCMTCEKRRRTA